MRKRGRLLTAVLLALTAWVLWQSVRPREPLYNGKTIRVWVEQFGYNEAGDPAKWAEALTNLVQIGTNALPCILELAATHDSGFKRAASAVHLPGALLERLALKTGYDRWLAASLDLPRVARKAFETMGPDARVAKPALVHLFQAAQNPQSRIAVIRMLMSFYDWHLEDDAQSTLPALAESLKDPSRLVRETAYEAIGLISSGDPPEVPEPAAIKHYEEFQTRSAKLLLPVLIRLLGDPNADCELVLKTLGDLGPLASEAVPAVRPLLQSSDKAIRMAAANALDHIEPN